MQPQMPQYPPQQPYYYPYPTLPTPPPAKQYPVPSGRRVPMIWAISLVTLTLLAALAALGGGLLRPVAPAPYGTVAYSGNLATDDGAWKLANSADGQCVYANGGLDATTSDSASNFGPSCVLQNHSVSDFRLSVRILSQAALNNPLYASIFVRDSDAGGVAFVVGSTGLVDGYVPNQDSPVMSAISDQWHSDNQVGNTLVIAASGSQYTLAMNGAQFYSGDLGGAAEGQSMNGVIGLGAVPPTSGTDEAIFADFSLTTP